MAVATAISRGAVAASFGGWQHGAPSMPDDPDFGLRRAALEQVRELSRRFDDLIPIDALRAGFWFEGQRVSFGSFYSGIFRPTRSRGPAALTLTTTPPKLSGDAPYDDGYDEATGSFVYHYRSPRQPTPAARRAAEADNGALRAAYLMGIDPRGGVHISRRLLEQTDGPMLRSGLQGFHGAAILQPRRAADRPDPERLELRYEEFRAVA
jgi:hypothetical protein